MAYQTSLPQRSATFFSRFPNLASRGRGSTVDTSPNDTTSYPGLHLWNDPQNALADIVFVHGIPGHPKKSFSNSDEEDTFWPLWLIDGAEHYRQCMRIWTFGYSSERRDGTVLVSHIEDHGRTLCTSLSFKLKSHNSIIFVAHSLGGLVVKAAINQAAQSETFAELSSRIHTVIFLATPHRHADDAAMLEKILRTMSEQPAIADPDPNAAVIETINKAFARHGTNSFRIWSFFEALPPEDGGSVIVDRLSATMNRDDEYAIRLHANHLSVARFVDHADPNYCTVRDALMKSVDDIAEELNSPERAQQQLEAVADYLGISDLDQNEQDELYQILDTQTPLTCQWLLSKPSFTAWVDTETPEVNSIHHQPGSSTRSPAAQGHVRKPRIFWLTGLPGSGKSHLGAAVIRHLENKKCSYYFLKRTDGSKHDIGGLLKSLALQMARRDTKLRNWLFEMLEDQRLERDSSNYMLFWKQVFEKHLFTRRMPAQFWVLDAIDEGRGGLDLIELLKKIPQQFQCRIFLTSRFDDNIERHLASPSVEHERISYAESREDIRLYLQAKADDFLAVAPEDVPELIDRILDKSKGSFLWTSLVVQRLSDVYAEQKIEEVLDSIPDEMNGFYAEILRNMLRGPNVDLAKVILRWTVCAVRPLTLEQLQQAIRLDLNQHVPRIDSAVTKTCGHLVSVEQGKVSLAHETIRDFLLGDAIHKDKETAVFALDKAAAHARLGEVCLMALSNATHPNARRELLTKNRTIQRGRPRTPNTAEPLYDYASMFFSEHIVKSAQPGSGTPVKDLEDFLQIHVREWIEHAAVRGDLARLIISGRNLKSFVDNRISFQARPEYLDIIRGWADDLIYLVTYFGRFMLDIPSAIQTTIPPLCPSRSMMAQNFGRPPQGLEVIGSFTHDWADRISSTLFESDLCSALACSAEYYAVGTRAGWIILFDAVTCQELWRIQKAADIKFLQLRRDGSSVIVSSRTSIALYSCTNGSQHWETALSVQHRAVTVLEDFDVSEIWAFTTKSTIVKFDLETGEETNKSSWKQRSHPHRVFMCGDELRLIALSYRNQPLEFRELENLEQIQYADVTSSTETVAFNPAKRTLIMALFDGELRVLQMWNWQVKCKTRLPVAHLSCSNDGELVLAGTNNGTIHILKSDTLEPIYQIQGEGHEIISLIFSTDDRRFIDIRRQLFNVWEPSALIRRKDGEKSSHEENHSRTSYSTAPSGLMQAFLRSTKSRVTAMVPHAIDHYVFCGKENGHVTVHETLYQGRAKQKLYEHNGSAISFLDWNAKSQVLVSCDRSSRILMHEVRFTKERTSSGVRETWSLGKRLLEKQLDVAVRQLLFSAEADLLVVSTESKDHLWTLDGNEIFGHACPQSRITGTVSQKWAIFPGHQHRLVEVEMTSLHMVKWNAKASPEIQDLEIDQLNDEPLEFGAPHVRMMRFGGGIWAAYDFNPLTGPILWRLPKDANSDTHTLNTLTHLQEIAPSIRHLIGEFQSRLLFIDVRGWVCSVSVDAGGPAENIWRHFPIPHYWQRADHQPLFLATAVGDIILAAEDEITIVKRGLTSRVLVGSSRNHDIR